MATFFAIIAILLYALSSYFQYSRIQQGQDLRKKVLWLGSAAVLFHGFAWFIPLTQGQAIHFSFFNVGSLIALVISAMIVLSALRKPIENLLLGIFPMAGLILAFNLASSSNGRPLEGADQGLISHIILSIMAYSILTIAAFQGILLMVQDHQLKHKHMEGIMRVLPPLQTMDRLLFEMIGVGTALLTLAIASGFLFLEDLFAQHLVHKTAFTLMAWAVYSFLLFAHWRFGWRGIVASRWTLAGTALLVLAYFGSKLVLEIILNKV